MSSTTGTPRKALIRVCGTLADAGMLAFALPISLSAGRFYMLPITLLLLPIVLVGLVLMCVFGPLAQAMGLSAHYAQSLHGVADADGVIIRDGQQQPQRRIEWDAIEKLVTIFRPPIHEHELTLRDGEVITLATLPTETLPPLLERHGIEWIGRDRGVPHWEHDARD